VAILHSSRLWLDPSNTTYLKTQIESGDPTRTKRALQSLCQVYRQGFRIPHDARIGVEQSIVGLLYTAKDDEKVRRWALNSLAHVGQEDTSMVAIVEALKRAGSEPQTAAAGVAAIYRLSRQPEVILKALSFDGQMMTLAALQHVDAKKLNLSALPIKIDTASPDILRLALIVVGLDRAPLNMLDPRHDNRQMVKALGSHDDSLVSQYSVWAIAENASLGVADLGIDIRNIEGHPANVRAWLFRLIAMTPEDAQRHFEYIALGTRDPDPEAKLGLALGLRETFFDGIQPLVLDWFTSEPDRDIYQALLDHMVKHASRCPNYEELAVGEYEKAPGGSAVRQRMEASAAGMPLFTKLRWIAYDGSRDLFRGAPVTNNTFNISGSVQGGAVSLGGDAKNSGSTAIHYDPQTISAIQRELSKAESELHALTLAEDLKREALQSVQAAKADPDPGKVAKALEVLAKVEAAATKTLSAGTAIAAIAAALAKVAGLF
jgi:hypothetical protein